MTKKTLLVGWDSACWEYLEPLLDKDELPNLGAIVKDGWAGNLRSTIPPITPAAWSSIVTGKLPRKHGVYDWVSEQEGALNVMTSAQVRGTPFWQRLNQDGLRAGLVNIPLTYPVTPVDGFALCGFGAPPSSRELTYPIDLLEELEATFGKYTPILSQDRVNDFRQAGAQLPLYQAEKEIQAQQVRAALYGARKYDVDVLAINLMLFDHTNHRARDFSLVEAAMLDTDTHLGLLIDGFQPDDVILFSDHGAERFKGLFLLGDWLAQRGYLTRQRKQDQTRGELNFLLLQFLRHRCQIDGLPEKALRAILSKAIPHLPPKMTQAFWRDVKNRTPRAFAQYWLHPSQVDQEHSQISALRGSILYLNEPTAPECTPWLSGLVRDLNGIRNPETGDSLMQAVLTKDRVYGDQSAGRPPDLFLDYYGSGFEMHSAMADLTMEQRYPGFVYFSDHPDIPFSLYGAHNHEGIYVFSGTSFTRGERAVAGHVVDVPANLLHSYGMPIPEDWDGEVLADAFAESRAVLSQSGDGAQYDSADSVDDGIGASDQDEVVRRLRELGYLE